VATEAPQLSVGRNRRVLAIVAAAAVAAAVAVVGATLLQTRGERTTVPGAVTKPRAGRPPLDLFFGVDTGTEARTLIRARAFYEQGNVTRAAQLFGRYRSPAARIGSAFAVWRDGHGVQALEQLRAQYPRSSVVALHLGWAYYWAGRNADAVAAWQRAARLQPDTPYAVAAEDVLHPSLKIPGLPPIVTGIALPKAAAKLPPAEQLAALRRAATGSDVRAKLLYGSALWTLEHPVSAEREFAAAARIAPHDALARVAAAVALFSKANPTRAFGHLGPLTAVFPHSAAVEFHLGVLLLYIGERGKATEHLRAAVADGPQSPYAKPAKTLLSSLGSTRSK
jgi:tetratricopeptide (TPR) repeat protein